MGWEEAREWTARTRTTRTTTTYPIWKNLRIVSHRRVDDKCGAVRRIYLRPWDLPSKAYRIAWEQNWQRASTPCIMSFRAANSYQNSHIMVPACRPARRTAYRNNF